MTLEEFGLTFRSSLRRDTLLHLGQLDSLHGEESIVLLGPPEHRQDAPLSHARDPFGLGWASRAVQDRDEWVALLADAQRQGRLDRELGRLQRIPLTFVGEVRCIPFDPEAANLIFMLVSLRYERAPLVATGNTQFSGRGGIFGDDLIPAAMIDRLVHHAEILGHKGDWYRLKGRDLARPPAAPHT